MRHVVCEEGSPVCSSEHTKAPSRNRAIKKSVEVLSYYSVSIPKGFCSHTHSVKDMTMTPGDRETPGLCTHYYAALHGFTVLNYADGVCPGERAAFPFKKHNLKNKKYFFMYLFLFN